MEHPKPNSYNKEGGKKKRGFGENPYAMKYSS